ncbi:hypothetical protein MXAN_6880 [Myxococcus xanthus DK 1622]|uniref:Lipoprotein n=2 Tax=Myxococcaceae TaxID=31 RepID=Q1CX78_MYXXD|nr:hypothetical protein MXAN_6880 [Myxococcus xanthus DK 1622]NOJ51257.1 hypothetical protein [Myxococcus xanthus]QPM79172.1 hypothetical protein I5Q59_33875 [Myxococcus xanthus]QVW68250.1 hypothetical protein JTM82_01405 [Myxococcus xanthus DZ2]UEO05636.1 hypothetical protein K1515_03575 [Myxococcus xanthus DZ2]
MFRGGPRQKVQAGRRRRTTMALKTGFAVLAFGMMFLGSTAAHAKDDNEKSRFSQQHRHDGRGGNFGVHVDARRHPGPAPLPPPHARGRYELQTVNRWVQGRYEQVWVPEVCRERNNRRSRVTRCTGGFYEQRWVPARYEPVQEWVWVTYAPGRVHVASAGRR